MMKSLPDINVWLALALTGHIHHKVATAFFADHDDDLSVAFCRSTQMGMLRLLTTEVVMQAHNKPALKNLDAWTLQQAWAGRSNVFLADEPAGIEVPWARFAAIRSASPKLWMDAYLAAFAIAGGFTLVTNDKAFKQFKGLDVLLLK